VCCVCVCDINSEYNVTDSWNGWLTEYHAALVLSQQFAAVQLVLIFSKFLCVLHLTLIMNYSVN